MRIRLISLFSFHAWVAAPKKGTKSHIYFPENKDTDDIMPIKTKESRKLPVDDITGPFTPLLRRDTESNVDRVNVGPGNTISERRGGGSPYFDERGSSDSDLYH